MKIFYVNFLEKYILDAGFSKSASLWIHNFIAFILLILSAYLVYLIIRAIIRRIIPKLVKRSKTDWDDFLLKRKFFSPLSWIIPLIIIIAVSKYIEPAKISDYLHKLSVSLLIINFLVLIQRFLLATNDIYDSQKFAKNTSIKAYIQLAIIIFYFVGIICIISVLIGKSPTVLLTGLGAFAAILMLIFKDSILGLVASIQLSANDMVNVGDWITIPSKNTDGTVIEVSLNTVKIQNWDKTISSIPTYYLVSESFTNWKGMEESGGRRVKRYINIDISSIKFLNINEIERLKEIKLLNNYLKIKQSEYYSNNQNNTNIANQKRLTNIGVFRKYIEEYLTDHPKVNNDMTFIVRQLQSNEKGLPLEIYIFSKEKEWVKFESVQSDIFDHLFAIIGEFELKVMQTINLK
jgi:miniconductance mechanosensitive channel